MFEKTIKKTEVFHGKMLSLEQHDVELEDGTQAYREIIRHPGSIGILARDPEGRFVFVRQYRKGVETITIEVIAGLLDPDEDAETAAHRELLEETGCEAESLEKLGTLFASPGYADESVAAYFAILKDGVVEQKLDRGERLEVVRMSHEEFSQAIREGKIQDAKTLSMWALFLERENR